MFKVCKNAEVSYLRNSITAVTPAHRYETRSRSNLVLPFPRVEAVRVGYQYQFIKVWNGIPASLRQIDDLKSFKREITEHFINAY